ncbi:Uncharacterised protein [Mycobacteroides abscessus subsp. abscessus]|nr:Uncharacterised protein [Mycobacteroides abscessus subsp. abscessus]
MTSDAGSCLTPLTTAGYFAVWNSECRLMPICVASPVLKSRGASRNSHSPMCSPPKNMTTMVSHAVGWTKGRPSHLWKAPGRPQSLRARVAKRVHSASRTAFRGDRFRA